MVEPAIVTRADAGSGIVLVCEHASNHFPDVYDGLGLSEEVRNSHAAWDPGALGVAERLSEKLDAPLIAGAVSRLIYDCNRPPDAPGAMLTRSEAYDIPGNIGLSADEKAARVAQIYDPFHATVSAVLDKAKARVMITVHSFTRVYLGQSRAVEIGVLHDSDARLADAMLKTAGDHIALVTQRNAPYGPGDGVMHTLKKHGISRGIPHVMLEVRNDLIETPEAREGMATQLAAWLHHALSQLGAEHARI
ncbi:N-formylglutamate amidohydrolase [Roseobacter insulae]|uniref:N-formylglutamate amidohydrolase n=1 Tax=Roseobacter insulae TaxID=2859783 RepID=UPI0027E527E2|nr:N-formylglutamate amidohydrolase [Roseobacter insulae]